MTIDELIAEGERVFSRKAEGMIGEYVPMEIFDPWRRKALMFLHQYYPHHPQVKTFEQHVGANNDSLLWQNSFREGMITGIRSQSKMNMMYKTC